MALGWCMRCDLLKPIQPVAQKWGSRECVWRPVPHDKPVHAECGAVAEVDDATYGVHYRCRKCDRYISIDEVRVVPCDGDRHDIVSRPTTDG